MNLRPTVRPALAVKTMSGIVAGRDQMNLTKFGKRREQLFPLLLRDGYFGGLRDTHPRIDFVLNPVVIRRTKKQLAH
jgi:hypothetical protein